MVSKHNIIVSYEAIVSSISNEDEGMIDVHYAMAF